VPGKRLENNNISTKESLGYFELKKHGLAKDAHNY
jgi:hypothetical protein